MNLKEFIFTKKIKGERITDQDVYVFLGKEPNYYTVEQYKREWEKLVNAKQDFKMFENNKNTIIYHSYRKYLLKNRMSESLAWHQIPKIYFEYLKEKGVEVFNP